MADAGTPHGRFRRALERRHLLHAETAARELGGLTLGDALALTALIAEQAPERYDRAAVRWLTRYCSESPNVDLVEALVVLSVLAALREDRPSALLCLVAVSRERGRTDVARAAEAALALRRPREKGARRAGAEHA